MALIILGILFFSNSVNAVPVLNFTSPTPANNTFQSQNWTAINVSIAEANLDTFKFNWNGTNTSFYDSSLVLALNFDNLTGMGENYNNSQGMFIRDYSKYGNNGTTATTATSPTWNSTGKYGGAFQFDGSNDYVNCGTGTSLNIPASDFTIEAWIKPNVLTAPQAIIGKIEFATHSWGIYQTGSKFTFQFRGTGGGPIISANSVYSVGTWYHVIVTRTGNTNRLYINGVFQTSAYTTDIPSTASKKFIIGKRTSTNDYYFNGSIDEVRIYNRSLSANEVKMQYYANLQKFNSSQYYFSTNISDGQGTYTYFGWANDSAGNQNQTETRTLTIDQCYCTSCQTCVNALNLTNCSAVKLTANITNFAGTCINNPVNFSNKIFDCQGHIIDGDDTGADYGIYLAGKQTNTIKNCIITDFQIGFYLSSSSNNTVINNTANSNSYGIYLYSSSNNTVINNTANSNTNHGIHLYSSSNNNTITNNTANNSSTGFFYILPQATS
ncbi:MAG: hypothetical protein BWK75_05705 [Candidatus Altiarchaeales archaeon A3]|nr:MAG: hypothetical protein BWK75_05705 [Candidatus Altiarchaeales archaeon A3]